MSLKSLANLLESKESREDQLDSHTRTDGGVVEDQEGPTITRRKALAGIGALTTGSAVVASQTGLVQDKSSGRPQEDSGATNSTSTREETETSTESEYTEEETETTTESNIPVDGSINAIPGDLNAAWADAEIFNTLNGDVDYEFNLEEARNRHYDDLEFWSSDDTQIRRTRLAELPENFLDEEWRQNLLDEYNEKHHGEDIELDFQPDVYQSDRPFDERLVESNYARMLYMFEDLVFGSVSSTQNQQKASVIQATEQLIDKNTLVWGHQTHTVNHGILSAIENPTENEDEYDQQETYVIETDYHEEHDVMNLAEEGYLNDDDGSHPAEAGERVSGMWGKMIFNTDGSETIHAESLTSTEQLRTNFAEFMLDPSSGSGQIYFDQLAIAADTVFNPEFESKAIRVGEDYIRYH